MNFMTLKRLMIVTKQSALKILEIEREYREAVKQIANLESIQELLKDDKDDIRKK